MSSDITFGERLSEGVRDGFDAITNWASDLGAIDLLLVVVILWAVAWLVSALRGMSRLGPVQVSVLEHDEPEATAPPVHELTAFLRERLAKSGLLPPPEVPAGSPQTNLIAAVEHSGHPQAAWAAALLNLLPHPPRPPQYTLSGTLFTTEKPRAAEPHALRYWLKPKNEGQARLQTVRGDTHETVVCRAAADVFRAIATDAVHVFAPWSRWESRQAFLTYMDAIEQQIEGNDDAARKLFEQAADEEPRNLLPRLHLANLVEKQAAPRETEPQAPEDIAVTRAHALRMYLDIGVDCPSLVAARYRASIVAGVLADDCKSPDAHDAISDALRLSPKPPDLHGVLVDIANDESKAALSLLRRFHVLIDKHRLRHRYEPSGRERRELQQTVAISRHARRIRQFDQSAPLGTTWRKAVVRFVHLGILRTSAGWNAHYNAGCFYALLLDRALAKERRSRSRSGREDVPGAAEEPVAADEPLENHAIRTMRRRAFEELNIAVDKAGGQLSKDWLVRDPDLNVLHSHADREWNLLVRRHSGQPGSSDPQLPEPAWGDPNRRRNELYLAAAVCALLAGISASVFDSVMLIWFFGVPAAISLTYGVFVHREANEANARALEARRARKVGVQRVVEEQAAQEPGPEQRTFP